MNDDALHYLIASEGGATALLATALAKPSAGEPLAYHRAIWQSLANKLDLALPSNGPSEIRLEDGNLDLVLLWGEWCIVFEVKVRSASVREGQLQEYYDLLRSGPEIWESRFPPTAPKLCMVFLTPAKVGIREYESLCVSEIDEKRHLAWEDLLEEVRLAIKANEDSNHPTFLLDLIRAGSQRITNLLRELKSRAVIEVTDELRLARRQFALDLQAAVKQQRPEWETLFRPLWSAPTVEEVYLSLDSLRRGDVYFTIFSSSIVVPAIQGNSTVHVRFWFKVAAKHRAAMRVAFNAFDETTMITGLNLSPELSSKVAIDRDKLSVILCTTMVGPRDDLISRCTVIFEHFVATFQRLFA